MRHSFSTAKYIVAFFALVLVAVVAPTQAPQLFGITPACAADDCTPKDGDKDRCDCWCSAYADQKAGLTENDPANESQVACDLRKRKQEYHDGFVAARDGEAKRCPYKK